MDQFPSHASPPLDAYAHAPGNTGCASVLDGWNGTALDAVLEDACEDVIERLMVERELLQERHQARAGAL